MPSSEVSIQLIHVFCPIVTHRVCHLIFGQHSGLEVLESPLNQAGKAPQIIAETLAACPPACSPADTCGPRARRSPAFPSAACPSRPPSTPAPPADLVVEAPLRAQRQSRHISSTLDAVLGPACTPARLQQQACIEQGRQALPVRTQGRCLNTHMPSTSFCTTCGSSSGRRTQWRPTGLASRPAQITACKAANTAAARNCQQACRRNRSNSMQHRRT